MDRHPTSLVLEAAGFIDKSSGRCYCRNIYIRALSDLSSSHSRGHLATSFRSKCSGRDRRHPLSSLLFSCAVPLEPRVSAAKVMLLADNFLQKQQKQRECGLAGPVAAVSVGRPRG